MTEEVSSQSPPHLLDPASTDAEMDMEEEDAVEVSKTILSPVSPRPVHLASDPPLVLKNQGDLAFNSTDAHHTLFPAVNTEETSNQLSGEPPIAQPQSQSLPYEQPPAYNLNETPAVDALATASFMANNEASSRATVPPSAPAAVEEPAPPLSASGNGNIVGPYALSATPANGSSSSNSAGVNGLPKPPLYNGVDLGALLTKLSPEVTAQAAAPIGASAAAVQTPTTVPSAQPPNISTNVTTASTKSSAVPSPASASSLPSRPPVSSSVPGHAAPAYPASLPPPPNFNQHKQVVAPKSPSSEDEEHAFSTDQEEEYSQFLADERDYVTQGQWDRFPSGSRLFIGNLPTEKVTKRDLFRIFHKHGRLAQVSIKQAYGFIQFLTSESCAAALRHEQGSSVRGRKMHLEVSKPQRNTRGPQSSDPPRRRSRSPDYGRGSPPRRGGGSSYRGRDGADRFRGSGGRDRDEYGRRSPPPRYRGRDDYRPPRRSRSRSRSPPGRYRPRSRTPPDVDDVPLPRRAPEDVPDVQILILGEELDRNFILWVENAFQQRGLRVDVLFLSPRLQISAVVKRQVVEGVQAVVFLNSQAQGLSKIVIQVFDRRGTEATYNQYDHLDPSVAAELVYRSKQDHMAQQRTMSQPIAQPMATYGGGYGTVNTPTTPQVSMQPAMQRVPQAAAPNLASVLGSLDPATLSTVLATLQGQAQMPQSMPQQQQPQVQQLDLSALLGGARQTPVGAHQQAATAQASQYQMANAYAQNPGLAQLLGRAAQQQPPPQQAMHAAQQNAQQGQQIGNIMETLAKWKQG